jgi:pyruvate,water dikinase
VEPQNRPRSTWEPPGPGVWWLSLEHFPQPISRLAAELIAPTIEGWMTGARRYGLPRARADFRAVNGWYYFSPGTEPAVVDDALEAAAAETLATRRWREEVRRWHEEERPAVLAAGRALQAVDPAGLDDAALADHVDACFEHTAVDIAFGLLIEAAEAIGVDGPGAVALLAGASQGSSSAARHLDAVAAALRARGVERITSLDEAAGPELDAYLADHGWQTLSGHDLDEPALIERPELVVRGINAALAGRHAPEPPADPRLGEVLDDARAAYGLRDDDVQLTFIRPLGLVRRALLEVGRRHDLRDPADVFESSRAELRSLPPATELARRADERRAAAGLTPPGQLGEGGPPPLPALPPHVARLHELQQRTWSVRVEPPAGPLAGIPVGTGVGRGPVRRVVSAADIVRLEPGDVLVTRSTTTAYGPVFPMLAAVVTTEGNLMSHAALLARELGLPCVVGVGAALDELADGDLVVVDADRGTVRKG